MTTNAWLREHGETRGMLSGSVAPHADPKVEAHRAHKRAVRAELGEAISSGVVVPGPRGEPRPSAPWEDAIREEREENLMLGYPADDDPTPDYDDPDGDEQ